MLFQCIRALGFSLSRGLELSGPRRLVGMVSWFQQAWLPFFSRASRVRADVDEFLRDFGAWLPTLDEISLPCATYRLPAVGHSPTEPYSGLA